MGLGFTADFNKEGGFIGDGHVLAQKAGKTLSRRLVSVHVPDVAAAAQGSAGPSPMLFHGEVVYRNGAVVGDVRVGSYGHTLGGPVGLAMADAGPGGAVTPAFVAGGRWEVDIGGVRFPASASLKPLYDPTNERIKA